jgi:ABC-type uncharacterized transport system involved in gliding motility auxiliary subunit
MTKRAEHRRLFSGVIVALLVGLVAFNVVIGYVLTRMRADLTQDRLYSLSAGARALLSRLDEPVRLDLYWTQGTSEGLPQIRSHAQRVREFLEELQEMSGGNVELRVIDPEPFSEAEEEARASGLPGLNIDGSGQTLTLGLVVRGPTDKRETIAYLAPEQEPFLEYEVLRSVAAVGRPDKPKLGIVSGMPLDGAHDPSQQFPPQGPPVVIEQLRALFDVRMIDASATALPEGLSTLLVVQPRKLSVELLRAIDAWAVAGKPLVVLADPYAETDTDPDARAMGAKRGGTTFDFGPLLASWGVQIAPDMVVGDRKHATRIQTRAPGGGARALDYPAWLTMTRDGLASSDPIVGSLSQINLMSAGAITPLPGATTTLSPLIQTSDDAQFIQTLKLGFFGDAEQLIKDFVSDGKAKVIAARISGPIASAFAGGEVGSSAKGNANILLVADADLLSDQTWLSDDQSRPGMGKRAVSDNGPFIVNAVELMAGDPALANVRGRGSYRRPFEVVEKLRRDAESKYIARERELQDEIRKGELQLGELQRERTPDGGQALVLSPQQAQEFAKLQARVIEARKELRGLQHNLRQDVEALGRVLLVVNTVLWPLLVAAAALVWYVVRGATSRKESTA